MQTPSDHLSAVERARWLAELALAVEQAQQLAREIGASEVKRREAQELYAQLDAIRVELEMLRRGRLAADEAQIDPKWIHLLGFTGPRAA